VVVHRDGINFGAPVGDGFALVQADGAQGARIGYGGDAAEGVSISLLSGTTGSNYLKDGDTGIDVPVTGATARYDLRAAYFLPSGETPSAGKVSTEIVVTADYE